MINLYGLLLGKASMLAQKLGSFLERRRRLFGGNWCGSLLPYPSKLSFYGLLCRIGSLQGVTKVMLSVYSAIIKLKVESIFSLNAVLVIEFGSFVCVVVEWTILL
jgi:hypothetical protein